MPDRALALSQCRPIAGLSHRACAVLLQYHGWPEHYAQMAESLAAHCGLAEPPRPSKAACGATAALARIHPQRLLLLAEHRTDNDHPRMSTETGAVLDLTHARAIIHIDERLAVSLLGCFVGIDLRSDRFAVDDIALTPLHRVGVVLWRRAKGFDILVPRSFARSILDVLSEAAQRLA